MRRLALTVVLALAGCDHQPAAGPEQMAGPRVASPHLGVEVESAPTLAAVKPPPDPDPERARLHRAHPFGLAPISAAERVALHAGAIDEIPESTRRHFVISNEMRHDLFFPYIADKGGIYVGVASDPNYTLMAVARSEFAFLIDIDRQVIDMHRVYEVLIKASADPQALVDRFARENQDDTIALLSEALVDLPPTDSRRITNVYRWSRGAIHKNLGHVASRERDGVGTSWLANPDYYGYVRRMYETGRIRVMPGNLLGDRSMSSIAVAARSLGKAVRVVYPSNAEDYFVYRAPYRRNIRALPVDHDSVVIRTISTTPINTEYGRTLPRADVMWHYQVQPVQHLQDWLSRQNLNRNSMLKRLERDGEMSHRTGRRGLSVVGLDAAS